MLQKAQQHRQMTHKKKEIIDDIVNNDVRSSMEKTVAGLITDLHNHMRHDLKEDRLENRIEQRIKKYSEKIQGMIDKKKVKTSEECKRALKDIVEYISSLKENEEKAGNILDINDAMGELRKKVIGI